MSDAAIYSTHAQPQRHAEHAGKGVEVQSTHGPRTSANERLYRLANAAGRAGGPEDLRQPEFRGDVWMQGDAAHKLGPSDRPCIIVIENLLGYAAPSA